MEQEAGVTSRLYDGRIRIDWDATLAFADKHLLGKQVDRRFDQFPADPAPGQ